MLLSFILLLVQSVAAQTCNDAIPASAPDSRFIMNGDEVTDTKTGLIWQHCSLGQTGSDCTGDSVNTYTWQQALQAAEDVRTNKGQLWRLPNLNELESIVEGKCYGPSINPVIFPNTSSSDYWSASPYAGDSGNAWDVHFYSGSSGEDTKSNDGYVRLVRDGQ